MTLDIFNKARFLCQKGEADFASDCNHRVLARLIGGDINPCGDVV